VTGNYSFGSYTWTDGRHHVRSPFAVQAVWVSPKLCWKKIAKPKLLKFIIICHIQETAKKEETNYLSWETTPSSSVYTQMKEKRSFF
jgi:hypothetical protein